MESNTRGPLSSSLIETCDTLYEGALRLRQPRRGVRFSVDAPLLTAFAATKRVRLACDIGTGCGVVGLGLALRGVAERVVGLELQEHLVALARQGAGDNHLLPRFEVVQGDVRRFDGGALRGRFDLVTANPPYWAADEGHLPDDLSRRIAGFEVEGSLADWFACGRRLLASRGRMCVVYPSRRLDVLLGTATLSGLGATRLRFVHPVEDRSAELVLLEARRGVPGRLEVVAPLVLKTKDGSDTPEAVAILSGRFGEL